MERILCWIFYTMQSTSLIKTILKVTTMNYSFKTILWVLAFLIFPIVSNCQVIQGLILDEETKKPIPFVNVAIIDKSIGTVSNERGEFSLPITESNYSDIVGVSSIGYSTARIQVEKLINSSNTNIKSISLSPLAYAISEVIIRPRNMKYVKVGNGSGKNRYKVGFGPNDKLGREMGTIIPVKAKDAYLEKAVVNIALNKYGKIKLRLNIYNVEKSLPTERINLDPIYFETDIKEGQCVIDLKKYSIKVDHDFFISIEYIENMGEFGLYFTFSFDQNPTIHRETNFSPWIVDKYMDKTISISLNAILGYDKNNVFKE